MSNAAGGVDTSSSQPGGSAHPAIFEELLTTEDVAAYLRVSVGTVRNWVSAGKLRPDCRVGNRPRWRAESVEEWVHATDDSR